MGVHHDEITFSNTYVLIKIEHALKQKNVCINNNVTKVKKYQQCKGTFWKLAKAVDYTVNKIYYCSSQFTCPLYSNLRGNGIQ